MKKLKLALLLAITIMSGSKSLAHDIEVANADGVTIYYNFNNDQMELEVTYKGSDSSSKAYAGKVVIPESVTYEGNTYAVTSIGEGAFWGCIGLTEMTIPNSVTSIGSYAFQACYEGLTELTIPNSVTSIGNGAFSHCRLTSITIPSSVTSITGNPLLCCNNLEKITVESDNPKFDSRENCNAIIETNSNKLIAGFKSTIIPNSVTSIGENAFFSINGLTELTIPNSVISIGDDAFSYCSGLTELTIGNSVTSIGRSAFSGCSKLTTLYSLNTTPPYVRTSTFDSNHYTTVNVFVPQEALEVYQSADVWKEFQKLQGIEGLGGEAEKCATPTIHYANNKLTFKCETEGVTYESTITDTDIASYNNDEIDLSVTYNITVYATKEGCEDSDVATATLCWIDVEPKTEGITDDDDTVVQQISATPVLIQSANGQITVTGLTDGTPVTVYDLSGQQVGTATSTGGQATVSTSLTTGTAAIVKMGDNKSVKVAVK